MMKKKEMWEDEFYIDPRPLTEGEKKILHDFIENYSLKKPKKKAFKKVSREVRKKAAA